jgi:methanogenic corrinoid protein MtbC1
MSKSEFRDRVKTGGAIRAFRSAVAEEVTNEFLARHPEWLARYGDRARQLGMEDAGYHQDFLAAAIESGEVEAFSEYAEWAARMLQARQIPAGFLAENLEQIGRALHVRLSPSDATTVDAFIRWGVERCLLGGGKAGPAPAGELDRLTGLYTEAALRGGRQAAVNLLLEAVRQGHPVIDLYAEVLQSAMYRIGRMWEENHITVAQEHMATAITQFVIAHLYTLIEPPERSRGKGVVTGVQGEFHQVGANMVADMLEADGWDVRFLGTDTPMSGVLEAMEEHEADILGISATMLFHISSVARLIDAVRAKRGSRIRILVGGGAFRAAPLLYKELGADGCARDVRSAVALANDLTMKDGGVASAKSVLVADDDSGVRKWLRRILERVGYQVIEAENGKEAMRMLREHTVHLVLMDLVMPEQEGLETIPQIKEGFPATKIIAMSGAFGGSFLLAAKALGASEALTKPIPAEMLLDKVRQVLGD